MTARLILLSSIHVALWVSPASAQPSEVGGLAVYSDLHQGKATASGAPYDRAAMTSAHPALPFGTWIRVANFESGRMADVVVNDRKKADQRLVVVSRAAADALGLDAHKTAPGSLLVIASPEPAAVSVPPLPAPSAPAAPGPLPLPSSVAPGAPPAGGQTAKTGGFRPFAALFGKEQGAAASPPSHPMRYGIPGDRYAPPATGSAQLAPLSAGIAPPPARNAPLSAMQAPIAPPIPPQTSASSPLPSGAVAPPQPGGTALPPASSSHPYRAQFGAFRRLPAAEELSGMLRGAGIPTSVYATPGTGLNVVVTDGGFASAEEAQRWIDYEAARRAWTDRPVVVR